jgi:hypothetical protein
MPTTRVAFAGLSPLSERIVRQALARDARFLVVEPWTELPSLDAAATALGDADILFVELAETRLPAALRALQAAAPRLRIVALAVDASWARVFELREHQVVMRQCVAEDLRAAITAPGAPAAHVA